MIICGEYKMVEYNRVQLALSSPKGWSILSSFKPRQLCDTKQLILN